MSLNGQYVGIERVAERVFKSGLNQERIAFYDIVEWVGDAIGKIGVPQAFIEKVSDEITISDYRGTLPTDMVKVRGVREYDNKYPMLEEAGTFRSEYESNNLKNSDDPTMLGYHLQDGYIYTNFEDGSVEISYTAFETDANGFPQIPDDERYIQAVESYCMYKIAKRLWLMDEIARDKFQVLEQDWLFYVNSARTSTHMPDLDQAEALKNQLQRMRQSSYHHATQFAYLNNPEINRVH